MYIPKRIELLWPHKGDHVLQNPETGKWEFCGNAPLPPRPLIEIESYGTEKGKLFDPGSSNLLIKGENLFALESLLPYYTGKVKMIYIDPPFNTGQDFEAYDDNFEHSVWLSMMKERLRIARRLLIDTENETGFLIIHLDDNEAFYSKLLADECFGRNNFLTSVTIKMADTSGVKMSHKEKMIPKIKHHLIIYAANRQKVAIKPQYEESTWEEALERYKSYIVNIESNYDEWKVLPLKTAYKQFGSQHSIEEFCIINAKRIFRTARNKSYAFMSLPRDENFRKIVSATGLIKFSYKKEEVLFASDKLREIDGNLVPTEVLGDIWIDIGHNNLANEGQVDFLTKKPEKLLYRLIDSFTKENDLVLDFFSGSGTAGAVAHKMNRKWIMIELNEQAEKTILERMQNVLAGIDTTGISKQVNWQGGGGLRFLEVGAPLIVEDDETKLTILNPHYTNGPLTRAVCAIEGFLLTGDKILQGRNGDHFAHITEDYVDGSYVARLHKRLPENGSLTIYALKMRSGLKLPKRVSLKKMQVDLVKPYLRKRK